MITDRTFAQEVSKRSGEAGAGLAAASKAIAVRNFMLDQDLHRATVRNAEKLGMSTLGMEMADIETSGDDMAGIIVTGDLYGDAAIAALQQTPAAHPQATQATQPQQAQPQPVTEKPTGMSTTAKVLTSLAAATLLGPGGVGVASLLGAFDKPSIPSFDDTATKVQAVQLYSDE